MADRAVLTVVAAAPADRETVASVLTEAFAADPFVTGLLPSGDVGAALTHLFGAEFDETVGAGGHAYLAVDAESGAALGAALWQAPNAQVPALVALRSLPTYVRTFRARFADAARSHHALVMHRPAAPHWYLSSIGTTASARGRGVASGLIRDRLRAADRDGVGTYLESSTPANVPMYERFGFVVRGPIPAWGTSSAIAMWRPAAP